MYLKTILFSALLLCGFSFSQALVPFKLPDTGQTGDYTQTFGEDSDYLINAPVFTNNGDGTITDNISGLMWQKTDGGEMTYENAVIYCDTLTLAGFTDWHMPNSHELFSILNHQKNRPALDTLVFTKTLAEYWWSSDKQIDDPTKIWSTNAGGGIGAHSKTETLSSGGTKRFHVFAVRYTRGAVAQTTRFRDNNDGTITDLISGLMWQKTLNTNTFTWENALTYAENLNLGGYGDWRLPNIKELQSLNNEYTKNPSLDSVFFKNAKAANYWSSTSLFGGTTRAWYISYAYGLITYDLKTQPYYLICVRGASVQPFASPQVKLIPAGSFVMGDHHGYVDPQHPSDELPMHNVKVDSFYIGMYELTNQQYCDYLNSAKSSGMIEVRNNAVYKTGDTNIFCYTNQFASYCSIGWNGSVFSVVDFRANHPVVGVMWYGAAAYCNWLSTQNGLQENYNLATGICDFAKNGFRLPTEAEWEYAGRGGQYNPYYIFPWGNDSTNFTIANWPSSGDPYEIGDYPYTTPVGFYNGELRLKSQFNWPGAQTSYQTTNGANAYGLYDMAGNVWEFVNDWYGQNYYSTSPINNPTGPTSGFIMPDGKPYRGMRGGNWYNGQWGHSRVANRNPSYYRGPQDPNHPWYHVGFRIARKFDVSLTKVDKDAGTAPRDFCILQNYPNPFNPSTTIRFSVPEAARTVLTVYNALGERVAVLADKELGAGIYETQFGAGRFNSGVYFCMLKSGNFSKTIKLILSK